MTTKTTTNTNCPIPGEGGFDPAGSVVFKVVIRATSPPRQALALGLALDDRSVSRVRCSNCIAPHPVTTHSYDQAVVRSEPDLT
jgi:hypothetical protein